MARNNSRHDLRERLARRVLITGKPLNSAHSQLLREHGALMPVASAGRWTSKRTSSSSRSVPQPSTWSPREGSTASPGTRATLIHPNAAGHRDTAVKVEMVVREALGVRRGRLRHVAETPRTGPLVADGQRPLATRPADGPSRRCGGSSGRRGRRLSSRARSPAAVAGRGRCRTGSHHGEARPRRLVQPPRRPPTGAAVRRSSGGGGPRGRCGRGRPRAGGRPGGPGRSTCGSRPPSACRCGAPRRRCGCCRGARR